MKNHVEINYDEKQNTFTFDIVNLDLFVESINESHVIANASGKDKFILISSLREKNQYIAVTGAGISDSICFGAGGIYVGTEGTSSGGGGGIGMLDSVSSSSC